MDDRAMLNDTDPVPDPHLHQQPSHPRVRRRNRLITSCLECRRRKVKCDRLYPVCTRCRKLSRECVFHCSAPQQRSNTISERPCSVDNFNHQNSEPDAFVQQGDESLILSSLADALEDDDSCSDEEGPIPEERDLEITPMVKYHAPYGNADDDDLLDLGIKVGKMRMTERIGGLMRPMLYEEMNRTLENPGADRRTEQEFLLINPTLPDHEANFLAPGPTYIAPGNDFIFGGGMNEREQSLFPYLPTRAAANLLVRKYYENVHFIARVMHWPTFQTQYDSFWTYVQAGSEPPAWQQSVILSVLFSAVASMTEEDIFPVFAKPKAQVVGNFQAAVEVALIKAHFLRLTKLETLQAFVIYLIPMCRDQLSRAHSALLGTAVRLAECMGLHNDPEESPGTSPIECHIRRMVWFQLSFLDYRTCEAQGPRLCIKREDYTTKFPRNVNDSELSHLQPEVEQNGWTDITCCKIRFECIEMQKILWHDRIRMEKKKISLTHCLGKIESFRKAMETKYGPIFDLAKPIQRYARTMLNFLIHRMYVTVTFMYVINRAQKIPDRLRDISLENGTLAMESAILLETTPELAKWRWYNGAYQQWHISFFLMSEVYIFPQRRQADRIWDILDFVFEADESWSRAQKARTIYIAIRDRAKVYQHLRRLHAPAGMAKGMEMYNNRKDGASPEDLMSQQACQETTVSNAANAVNSGSNPRQFRLGHVQNQAYTQPSPPHLDRTSSSTSSGSQSDYFPQTSGSDGYSGSPWPMIINNDQIQWSEFDPNFQSDAIAPTYDSSSIDLTYILNMDQPKGYSPPAQAIAQNGESGSDKPRTGSVLFDIDWQEWDQIFPPEINSVVLDTTDVFSIAQSVRRAENLME